MKLNEELPARWYKKMKIIIKCVEGSHNNVFEIEKQINDKERIAAALENKEIYEFIKKLII
jgi:hypothetical protein